MKKTKIFINGFGRIGRHCAKILSQDDGFEITGINDLYSKEQMLHLFTYDSIYGHSDPALLEDAYFFNQKDPHNLPLEDLDIDVVLQCSGQFLTSQSNTVFIKKSAKKVIISAPAQDNTPVFIMGINEHTYCGEKIISASSCSANALVPVLALIDQHYGVRAANASMVHSYTTDQNLLDVKHPSRDIRRSRSSTQNILPLFSSAAYAITRVMPHLKDKITATSIRVNVSHCTFYDITLKINQPTTIADLKKLLIANRSHILDTTTQPNVSSDYIHSPYSATIDLSFTEVIEGDLLKISAWQDNEYGYARRLVELTRHITVV